VNNELTQDHKFRHLIIAHLINNNILTDDFKGKKSDQKYNIQAIRLTGQFVGAESIRNFKGLLSDYSENTIGVYVSNVDFSTNSINEAKKSKLK
ncbi:20153_t:CDS:1, partial [Racocetra fulgida]